MCLQGWFRPKLNRQVRVGSQLRQRTLTPQATLERKKEKKEKRFGSYDFDRRFCNLLSWLLW